MNNIVGRSTSNPLPDGDPESLAENFADFFMTKIDNVRKKLDDVPLYEANEIGFKQVFQ